MTSNRRSSRVSLHLTRRNKENKDQLVVQFISDDDVKIITHLEDNRPGDAEALKVAPNTPQSNRKTTKRRFTNIGVETIKEETNIEDDLDIGIEKKCEKPRDLCDEDDIEGGEICSFQTPRKRQGMLLKAKESASKHGSGTPKSKRTPLKAATPKRSITLSSSKMCQPPSRQTPKKRDATESKDSTECGILIAKTPYNTRSKFKRAIKVYKKQLEYEDSDEDEDSDSDFEGSGSASSETEASGEEDSDSGKGSEGSSQSCRRSLRFQPTAMPSAKERSKDVNYIFTADEYFESKSTKCKTSDHVLNKLHTPRLDASEMVRLLKDSSVTPAHCSVLTKRREGDLAMYERWMIALSQGFSILAYGLGSKYKILQKFHCKMLPESRVLVVNGFFPSLSIKEIVETLARDLLGLKQSLPSPHAVIEWIEGRRWMPRVFLVIHNIDAEPLRCNKTQQLLAQLASLPRVHLIASIDHINCPLLWDQAKLSAYNFMWEDTTSFLPYQVETSYETSLMVHNSGSLALSSLLNVYRSLTHNSRGVFRIILQKHLDENNAKYNGMAFSELYGLCREEMLVTSDLALRTMLTEFLDHQMVKWRKDGEHLYMPTDIAVLRQFSNLTQND